METRYVDTTLGRVAYTFRPGDEEGPRVMLVHGLPTSRAMWEPVIRALDPRITVAAPDLLDYGDSAKAGPVTHKQHAATLDRLRAELGWDRYCLAAHDLGSSVAIDVMGAFFGPVDRLVLSSPPVYPDFDEPAVVELVRLPKVGSALLRLCGKAMMRMALRRGLVHKHRLTNALLDALYAPFDSSDGRRALRRVLLWGTPDTFFADYPAIIRSIAVPTLVLQGRQDPYIPRDQVDRLERDIADSRLVFIDDGAHFLPIDTPGQVADQLNRFLF